MSRHLITSALPYVNGVKHLGNLVGSMLPADIYARYLRRAGHEVLYICATDEHGTPAELAALKAGLEVDEYCRQQHAIQQLLGERFQLSWNHFGRSSSVENRELTHHFAAQLHRNGYLEERAVDQIYSIADGRYLPDRYITGTCPRCHYDRARGDQCESCGALLDPTDLLSPRSTVSGATDLEVRRTKHLFLRQSSFEGVLREWIDANPSWPTLTTSIARKWLDEGLRDRCITRDLTWGVPVNVAGYEGKVFYVWFDAPIEYIGATYEWANAAPDTEDRDWRSWWYEADDVTYTQFMAKDNIPFHTLSFPCTIIGSGEPWKLATYIKGFSWLTYYGGKFSTSDGRGIFMDDALDLLPADYWRWFLVANAPESSDSTFTWEAFADAVNKDLAGTLGNYVNRTLTLSARAFGPIVPAGGTPSAREATLAERLASLLREYDEALAGLHFRRAAQRLRAIWSLGNQYLDSASPWLLLRSDPVEAALVLRTAINLIAVIALASEPILPTTSAKLFQTLGLPSTASCEFDSDDRLDRLPAGQPYTIPDVLFEKVAEEDINAWRDRFGAE
jgi:methionyl-tRNA synthetase